MLDPAAFVLAYLVVKMKNEVHEKLMIGEAKQIDMVDCLTALGHRPQKIRNKDYWYLSLLRTEKTPSFKVNRSLNGWYDHSIGKGGYLVDFGILYLTVR